MIDQYEELAAQRGNASLAQRFRFGMRLEESPESPGGQRPDCFLGVRAAATLGPKGELQIEVDPEERAREVEAALVIAWVGMGSGAVRVPVLLNRHQIVIHSGFAIATKSQNARGTWRRSMPPLFSGPADSNTSLPKIDEMIARSKHGALARLLLRTPSTQRGELAHEVSDAALVLVDGCADPHPFRQLLGISTSLERVVSDPSAPHRTSFPIKGARVRAILRLLLLAGESPSVDEVFKARHGVAHAGCAIEAEVPRKAMRWALAVLSWIARNASRLETRDRMLAYVDAHRHMLALHAMAPEEAAIDWLKTIDDREMTVLLGGGTASPNSAADAVAASKPARDAP